MIKLITPGSYDFGEASTQQIKIASNGLRGKDLSDFIKSAGSKAANAFLNELSFNRGEVPIHLIAIGSTEFFGPNRNGDGFTEDCCRKYHNTFVKHARWYRNHANKDKSKSYGIVKQSWYNDTMHRLELIVALNSTKEAAARNNGLVADEELEKLASGKELATSMACHITEDVCSGCGNRAKTRDDYCTEATCKYGGCKNNLCKVAEDGHILYVDNPIPRWFDISHVFRPADRIAYVFGKLEKQASGSILSSAELAEIAGIEVPFHVAAADIGNSKVQDQLKIAYELAEIENQLLTAGHTKRASALPITRTKLSDISGAGKNAYTRLSVLKALSQQKLAMSFTDFIEFVSDKSREQAESITTKAAGALRAVFRRMIIDHNDTVEKLASNPFLINGSAATSKWEYVAYKQADNALTKEANQKRVWTQALRGESVILNTGTHESVSNEADQLARMYGLYKIALAYEHQNDQLFKEMLVCQNYVR